MMEKIREIFVYFIDSGFKLNLASLSSFFISLFTSQGAAALFSFFSFVSLFLAIRYYASAKKTQDELQAKIEPHDHLSRTELKELIEDVMHKNNSEPQNEQAN